MGIVHILIVWSVFCSSCHILIKWIFNGSCIWSHSLQKEPKREMYFHLDRLDLNFKMALAMIKKKNLTSFLTLTTPWKGSSIGFIWNCNIQKLLFLLCITFTLWNCFLIFFFIEQGRFYMLKKILLTSEGMSAPS